jgi:hypothetical protein
MANQRKIIGKIPVYRGNWSSSNAPYHKLNDVTLYGCMFRSKIENNSYQPATIGAGGELVVNENWYLVTSGYESEAIKEDLAFIDNNTNAYNVSRFHSHTGFWEAIEYDESQPAYMEAQQYSAGSKVNLVNYTNHTFVAMKSLTGVQPDINTVTNKFTLEEAVLLVPKKYQLSGIEIGFISSETNKPVFHRYNGGTFTSVDSWTGDTVEKLTELENITTDAVADITSGKNLLDVNRKAYGGDRVYISGSTGKIVSAPDYPLFISHLIPLKQGQTHLTISTASKLSRTTGYRFLDAYGNIVGFGWYTDGAQQQTITIPEKAPFAQFSISENYSNVQIEYGETATEYESYIDISDYALKKDIDKTNNVYLVSITNQTISSGLTGVKKVGDRFFNIPNKLLYECIEFTDKSNFKVKIVELNTTNLYICGDEIYTYNGDTLVVVRNIEIKLSDITNETSASGKVNVKAVGDIYYRYGSGVMYIVKTFNSNSDFTVGIFQPKPYHIFNYKGVLFKYVDKALIPQREVRNAFLTASKETVSPSDSVYINFPNHIKHGKIYSFTCRFEGDFDINVMHGTNAYTNGAIKINNTAYQDRNFRTNEWNEAVELGFIAKDFLTVVIKENEFKEGADVIIMSSTGMKKSKIQWNGCQGNVYGYVTSGDVTDGKISVSFPNVYKDIWFFGDSYFDIWVPLLEEMTKGNYMVDGHAGRQSAQAYQSLLADLTYHIPHTIVWCMGMNDNDVDESTPNQSWIEHLGYVMNICKYLGINLILATIPLVPSRNNKAKNNYIRDSGYKYIDVNKVVGGDISENWYDGFCLDGIHPTELAGYAIAADATIGIPNL